MPTTAKLLAAVWFAALTWLAANAHIPALGEGASFGRFREIAALIGLICGWRVMGAQVGKGYADAVGTGLKCAVITAVFALMLFSGNEMIAEAMKMHFDGPMDAILGWIELIMVNAQKMLSVGVIGVMIVAGLVGGPMVEFAGRRWR